MQMIIGLIVLVLLAVGVSWYMGNTVPATETAPTDSAAMMEKDAMMEE